MSVSILPRETNTCPFPRHTSRPVGKLALPQEMSEVVSTTLFIASLLKPPVTKPSDRLAASYLIKFTKVEYLYQRPLPWRWG